ncbi:hypothetical protein R6Q59_018243 [Mikania micrantha]
MPSAMVLSSNLSCLVMFNWLIVVLILITSYTATLASMYTVEQFELASNEGIYGFHGNSFMRGVTLSNLHFENHKLRPYYSYQDCGQALSKGGKHGGADAIVDEVPYTMFLSKYPHGYAMVSSQPITSGFGFMFPKGSRLGAEVSKEIVKMRFDGTLGGIERRWFRSLNSFASEDTSIRPKSLRLDRFGGLFIVSGIFTALALVSSVVYVVHVKLEVHNIIAALDGHNLMASVRSICSTSKFARVFRRVLELGFPQELVAGGLGALSVYTSGSLYEEDDAEHNMICDKHKHLLETLPKGSGWRIQHLYNYNGFWLGPMTLKSNLLLHTYFKSEPTDIILASFMKFGTTWLQALMFSTLNRDRYSFSNHHLHNNIPQSTFPYLDAEDPKDVLVSKWHFMSKLRSKDLPPLSFDEAFELFCLGVSEFGAFWEHVQSYWRASLESPGKILFLRYEELKKQLEVVVRKLADFMGKPVTMEEEKNGVVGEIIKLCSFENLRNLCGEFWEVGGGGKARVL